MAVYVDDARHPFGRMLMGHMLADTLGELHDMARAIGMQRRWYQPLSHPHYDVSLERRAVAVSLGALQVDRRGIVTVKRRLSIDPAFRADVLEQHSREGLPFPRFLLQDI